MLFSTDWTPSPSFVGDATEGRSRQMVDCSGSVPGVDPSPCAWLPFCEAEPWGKTVAFDQPWGLSHPWVRGGENVRFGSQIL